MTGAIMKGKTVAEREREGGKEKGAVLSRFLPGLPISLAQTFPQAMRFHRYLLGFALRGDKRVEARTNCLNFVMKTSGDDR